VTRERRTPVRPGSIGPLPGTCFSLGCQPTDRLTRRGPVDADRSLITGNEDRGYLSERYGASVDTDKPLDFGDLAVGASEEQRPHASVACGRKVVLGVIYEQAITRSQPDLRGGQLVDFRARLAEADPIGDDDGIEHLVQLPPGIGVVVTSSPRVRKGSDPDS